MKPAEDTCTICGGDVGWWVIDEVDNGVLRNGDSAYCGVCRPWRDVVEIRVGSLLPWQRQLIENKRLAKRLRNENFRRFGGAPRVLHRWVKVLHSISRDDRAREAISRIVEDLPDDVNNHWEAATQGHLSRILTRRVRDMAPSPPEEEITNPNPHRTIGDTEFFGHRVIVYPHKLRIDGELIDGGPLHLLAKGLLEFDIHRPSQRTAVMSFRALHRNLARDSNTIEMLIERAEIDAEKIFGNEDLSLPWCSWDERGYIIENPSWMRRLAGIRNLRLPDSLFLCDWFSHIWHGWYGEDAANELKLACMHWMKLAYYVRDGGIPEPIRRSFRLLRSLVEEEEQITVSSSGIMVQGNSGLLWRIGPVSVDQHPYWMRFMGDRMHLQFWRVCARNAATENARMRSVCLHPGNRRAPLGDQLATLSLGLVHDDVMAKRIGQIGAAIHRNLSGRHGLERRARRFWFVDDNPNDEP